MTKTTEKAKKTTKKLVRKVKKICGVKLTKGGAEICNPKPKKLQTGMKRRPTQEQRWMAMMDAHQARMKEDEQYADETDFEDEEDFDMLTSYEERAHVFDMIPEVPQDTPEGNEDQPATHVADTPPNDSPESSEG